MPVTWYEPTSASACAYVEICVPACTWLVSYRPSVAPTRLPDVIHTFVEQPVAVEAAGSKLLPLRLTVGAEAAPPGTHKLELHVRAVEDATVARDEHTTFILPKP